MRVTEMKIKVSELNNNWIKLKDIINNLQKFDTCKIESIIAVNFIFFKDLDEECVKY